MKIIQKFNLEEIIFESKQYKVKNKEKIQNLNNQTSDIQIQNFQTINFEQENQGGFEYENQEEYSAFNYQNFEERILEEFSNYPINNHINFTINETNIEENLTNFNNNFDNNMNNSESDNEDYEINTSENINEEINNMINDENLSRDIIEYYTYPEMNITNNNIKKNNKILKNTYEEIENQLKEKLLNINVNDIENLDFINNFDQYKNCYFVNKTESEFFQNAKINENIKNKIIKEFLIDTEKMESIEIERIKYFIKNNFNLNDCQEHIKFENKLYNYYNIDEELKIKNEEIFKNLNYLKPIKIINNNTPILSIKDIIIRDFLNDDFVESYCIKPDNNNCLSQFIDTKYFEKILEKSFELKSIPYVILIYLDDFKKYIISQKSCGAMYMINLVNQYRYFYKNDFIGINIFSLINQNTDHQVIIKEFIKQIIELHENPFPVYIKSKNEMYNVSVHFFSFGGDLAELNKVLGLKGKNYLN
jgi:hypothetical protein